MNQEMDPSGLLRAAARLVRRALDGLDTSAVPCAGCGRPHFARYEEAKVFEQLANLPERLSAAADKVKR